MGGSGGLQEVTYAVPADKCGLVIGKGEENVSVPRLCSLFSVSVLSTRLSSLVYITSLLSGTLTLSP